MSAHPVSAVPANRRLLGEFLHSLSQPLTSLRCALELSVDGDRSGQSISAALEQADTAIRMVRLMREYLDSEPVAKEIPPVLLMPILRSLSDDLSSVAAVKGIHLQIAGSSKAAIPTEEPRLRVALQYLIQDVIDRQIAGNKVIVVVRDRENETILQAQGEQVSMGPNAKINRGALSVNPSARLIEQRRNRRSTSTTIRRVRLAIASQVLENIDATVTLNEETPGFVVIIPRPDRTGL